MKIAEIEAKIKNGDCSAETLALFKTALKRVPKNGRCQHCYTTAAQMPTRFYKQAIELIKYGLQEHCVSWSNRMLSYRTTAEILEKSGDYVGAKQAYSDALSSIELDPEKRSGYESYYAAQIMRAEMHISNFEYTDDLECYYNIAVLADDFSQSFQKTMFYRLLAEIIIFSHHKDLPKAKSAFEAANEMLSSDFVGPLTKLLKTKHFIETAGATNEALDFLKRAKRWF